MALILEKMVEQMGVEPTTYTMRTYRSSQLSYCPVKKASINIYRFREKSRGFPFFPEKKLRISLSEKCGRPVALWRSSVRCSLDREKTHDGLFFILPAGGLRRPSGRSNGIAPSSISTRRPSKRMHCMDLCRRKRKRDGTNSET